MALVRRLIGGGLAVAVALALLLAAFSLFISPDAVRDRVVASASELTGFQLEVNGPTRLHLFPSLTFELNDVAFRAADGADAEAGLPPVATAHRLVGGLDVWRLLTGDLVPDSLTLVRPRIAIVSNEDGSENWRGASDGAFRRAVTATDEGEVGSIRIGRIGIEDGRVVYLNKATGVQEEISSLDSEVNWPRLGSWMEGHLSGVWRGEIFSLGFNAPQPLRLMRGGRSGLQVEAAGAGARILFRGQAALEAGRQMVGDLEVSADSLRTLADLLGVRIEPGPGLNEMSVTGDLTFVNGVASLADAELSLDNNRAEGTLEIDATSSVPTVRGTLATETLDLNAYRAVRQGENATGASPGILDLEIEPEHLERVAADVRFSAARILIGEMTFGRTAGTITSRPGALVLGLAETGIYGGIGAGTLNLTNDGAGTRWDAVLALDEVEVQPLFQALVGLGDIRGTGTLRLNASGEGSTLREVISDLSGKGNIDISGGVLSGFEAQGVARALAAGRLVDLPSAGSGASQFDTLAVALELREGTAWIEQLRLEAGALRVEGEGQITLPEGRIEGTAAVHLKDASAGTESIPEMPLVIRGTLQNPRLYPPPRWLLQQASPAIGIDPISLDVPAELLRRQILH